MKIGDKVNFLNASGGGTIAGFQNKNIVLVEDEDGFQIPTKISDVVLVSSTDDYDISNVIKKRAASSSTSVDTSNKEEEPADRPITFQPRVEERKEGNKINCYLAFVPTDPLNFSQTRFECYFVNDSNYNVYYAFLENELGGYTVHHTEEVDPNTLSFIEELGYDEINKLERSVFQIMAYKRHKNFLLKPSFNINLHIDLTKFYKLHCFQDNDFFESKALIYPIISNDTSDDYEQLEKSISELKDKGIGQSIKKKEAEKEPDTYVRRYDDQRHKSKNPLRPKSKTDELVVDLHATALLDTTAGLKAGDILQYQLDTFRKTLNQHQKDHGLRIVFIHGKGEGVLRKNITDELRHKFKNCTFQDASFQEYGYGATLVIIK